LVGKDLEMERRVGSALKQQYYNQLREDMEKHTGMPAIQASKHKECITSMKVKFKGIWPFGNPNRTLLRKCRTGGWGDFRTLANGKCIACKKEKPTITHCLTKCDIVEPFDKNIEDVMTKHGVSKQNRVKSSGFLKHKDLRLHTMLGVLPDKYFTGTSPTEQSNEARKERWVQAAKTSEALSNHAVSILREWLDKIKELQEHMDPPSLGWYHSTRDTGYQ